MKYNVAWIVGVGVWSAAWVYNVNPNPTNWAYFLWVVGAIAFGMLACYFTALWYGE